jgi:hypothetical protein
MFSQKSREGYILLDHRASPGFTEEQARTLNLPYEQTKEGAMFEAASLTCAHCKCAVIKNPLRTRERAHCFKCNHYICDLCEAKTREPDYIHKPFEAQIQEKI